MTVTGEEIERAFERWPEGAVPVKVREYREIWRMELGGQGGGGGRGAYLKWYPRGAVGSVLWAKKLIKGDPALKEYSNLVRLGEIGVAAPKAVALLSGLVLSGRKGDGVLAWAVEPGVALDEVLHGLRREGLAIPRRWELVEEVVGILEKLRGNRMGHSDLHFGNFLRHDGRLYLLDAYAAHYGGMYAEDLEVMGHAAQGHATRTELLRAWKRVGAKGTPLPPLATKTAQRQWRKAVERATTPSAYVGEVRVETAEGLWRGLCFKQHRFPLRYAPASGVRVEAADWEREFGPLWEAIRGETLRPLKRSASGDVWSGEVVLAGVPVGVVVKRPYRNKVYRYVTEIGRGSRAWRGWKKSWMLIARGIPTAWPLLVLERRVGGVGGRGGVVVDQLLVCERVEGEQLDGVDLDSMGAEARDRLLRRVGRLLRRIDDSKIVHFDTKASNIMIRGDEVLGPGPVLVDVDGVRGYTWRGEVLARLERSMRDHHPHYTEADARSLRAGYAPFEKTGGK